MYQLKDQINLNFLKILKDEIKYQKLTDILKSYADNGLLKLIQSSMIKFLVENNREIYELYMNLLSY